MLPASARYRSLDPLNGEIGDGDIDEIRQGKPLAGVEYLKSYNVAIFIKIYGYALLDVDAVVRYGIPQLDIQGICFTVVFDFHVISPLRSLFLTVVMTR